MMTTDNEAFEKEWFNFKQTYCKAGKPSIVSFEAGWKSAINAVNEQNEADAKRYRWIGVEDELPTDSKAKLAWVKDTNNLYGGHLQIVNYGEFSFCVPYGYEEDYPDMDEDGEVHRTGWHYERDSEGEFDSIIFDMNGKVTHWQPLPEKPKE